MQITRIRGAASRDVLNAVKAELSTGGFVLSNVRLSPTHAEFKVDLDTERVGHNVSPYSGRRGRSLGWFDWVWVNDRVNDVLDSMSVSANVQTAKGLFVIRRGTQRFNEDNWRENAYRNVGSVMNPVYAIDAWLPASDRTVPEGWQRPRIGPPEQEDRSVDEDNSEPEYERPDPDEFRRTHPRKPTDFDSFPMYRRPRDVRVRPHSRHATE